MEDTKAEALPIGAAEAAAALQTLQRYKAGKAALDKRLIDNELWFRMGHWKNYRDPLMPGKAQPSSGSSGRGGTARRSGGLMGRSIST